MSLRASRPRPTWSDHGRSTEIGSLGLDRSGSVDAILADGSQIELNTLTCFVDWLRRFVGSCVTSPKYRAEESEYDTEDH